MFVKTFASSEPTLQNLRVVEVKIANVENSNYKIINALVVYNNSNYKIINALVVYNKGVNNFII